MRRTLVASLALAVLVPLSAQAQQWTTEQQDVWEFEKACWEVFTEPRERDPDAYRMQRAQALETIMACFHDDFVGWGMGRPVPTRKADRRPFFARSVETERTVFQHLQPLAINVHGNVAIVIYLATYTTRGLNAPHEEKTVTERWTDICLKEGNRWTWIADHGSLVSDMSAELVRS